MNKKRLFYIAGISDDSEIGHFIRQDMINIKAVLENYENEGQIILRTDEYATKRMLINRFMNHKILPWLFYYSGHSDDNSITLSDSSIPADTFVDFFDSDNIRNSLHLMYLGSCNSISIGQKLINKGIKMVIVSDDKVSAHLANIVSKFFFNSLFTSKNIKDAYKKTKALYNMDRSSFKVNEKVDFPWQILSSNESNLTNSIEAIRMSSEQKHQVVMNSTSIRLEMLNYYITADDSSDKQTDLIKKEVSKIKTELESSMEKINETIDIQTLIKPIIESPTIDFLPNKDRFMSASGIIKNLSSPDDFVKNAMNQMSNLKSFSESIIEF